MTILDFLNFLHIEIETGTIISSTYVRRVVQKCFDQAIEDLHKDGFNEEAESILAATVHWLRHTGISEDVIILELKELEG